LGAEQADRELADEAEAHDDDRLTRLRTDKSDTLKGDGRERSESGVLSGDTSGDAGGEGRIGRNHFGVRSIGDHAVAGSETRDLARIEDFPDVAVAERNRLREFAADGRERREKAFAADLGEDGAEFLRLLPGLAQPATATELDEHPFRAQRDQRTLGAHEQTAAPRTGGRHGEEFGAARAQMLDELTQDQE
jgi:hypothetical protein